MLGRNGGRGCDRGARAKQGDAPGVRRLARPRPHLRRAVARLQVRPSSKRGRFATRSGPSPGKFPGGAVGRLRHQALFGETLGMDVARQHTIMVARLPETVGYVPMLCVRPAELMSGLYYWGGDKRPRDTQRFESPELDRRYIVEIAKAQGQNWLWQLFSPGPDRLDRPRDAGRLRLQARDRRLHMRVPAVAGAGAHGRRGRHRAPRPLVESSGKVASRIRDEVLEEIGTGSASSPDSLQAYVDWVSGPKHGKIIGAILKLAGRERNRRFGEEFRRRARARGGVPRDLPLAQHHPAASGSGDRRRDGHAPRQLAPGVDRLDHVLERRRHGAELRRGRRRAHRLEAACGLGRARRGRRPRLRGRHRPGRTRGRQGRRARHLDGRRGGGGDPRGEERHARQPASPGPRSTP